MTDESLTPTPPHCHHQRSLVLVPIEAYAPNAPFPGVTAVPLVDTVAAPNVSTLVPTLHNSGLLGLPYNLTPARNAMLAVEHCCCIPMLVPLFK